MKLTPKERRILDGLIARPESHVSRRWVGRQVAGCYIPDPAGFGGVTADEMDKLDDWEVDSRAVDKLLKRGLLKRDLEAPNGYIGWLRNWYEFFSITDDGRAAVGHLPTGATP